MPDTDNSQGTPWRALARRVSRLWVSRNWATVLLLLSWQAFVSISNVNSIVFPSPIQVFRDLLSNSGLYLAATVSTVALAASGLAVGLGAGTAIAVLAWLSPVTQGLLAPVALLFTSVPIVTLIPIIARIAGYGPGTVFTIVAGLSFFPTFVFTSAGLKVSASTGHDLFSAFGASPWKRFILLTAPAALPSWMVGLRIAAPFAILSAMLAEFLMGTNGLGYVFRVAAASFDTQRALGASVIAMAISVASFALARYAERRISLRWQ
jgi:ABC-type nitrate/sulfonate/bicarbonate transport system permease component